MENEIERANEIIRRWNEANKKEAVWCPLCYRKHLEGKCPPYKE